MENKTMKVQMSQRSDSAENWESVNPILLNAEIGYDETNKKIKIGDGETHWNDLDYTGAIGKDTGSNSEIFNDYTNNKAASEYSHAEGYSTFAGGKAFKIVEEPSGVVGGEGIYKLDSVEGIEVGMRYSAVCSSAAHDAGEILSIDTDTYSVTVSNYPGHGLNTNPEDPDNYKVYNTFMITDHPELGTVNVGFHAHAEGDSTNAHNIGSHAEGYGTNAIGKYSHAEGYETIAGYHAHSEGRETKAIGDYSHAEGRGTIADSAVQHVSGKYNIVDSEDKYAHIVGNGTSDRVRSNAYTLDWKGNAEFAGDITAQGNISVNDVNMDTLNTSLDIYGSIDIQDDGSIIYPNGITEIIVDDTTIFNGNANINPLYGLSKYKDILSIGTKTVHKHNIEAIHLTSDDSIPWTYATSRSTETYNVFYTGLHSATYADGTKVIPKIPYVLTDDAAGFLGDNIKLTFSPNKEYFDGAFWIEQDISASTGEELFRVVIVSQVGGTNITTKSEINKLSLDLYVALYEPYEEVIEDKFIGVWTSFLDIYNDNSVVTINGVYENSNETALNYGIGHSLSDTLESLTIPDDLTLNTLRVNSVTTPVVNTISCITANAKSAFDISNNTEVGNDVTCVYFPWGVDNANTYYDGFKGDTTYPMYRINKSYGDNISIYRDKLSITHNVKVIKLNSNVKYNSWTQATSGGSLTKNFFLNLHIAIYSDTGETLLSADEIAKIASGECSIYIDDAKLTGYEFNSNGAGQCTSGQFALAFNKSSSDGTYYLRMHVIDDNLSDIRELNSGGSYVLIDPANMAEGSNDIRTKDLYLYIATKLPTVDEYDHPEYVQSWDSLIGSYSLSSDIRIYDDLGEVYITAIPEFDNMEIALNKRIDEISDQTNNSSSGSDCSCNNSNIVNGEAEGSLRTIGATDESDSYKLGEYAFAEGRNTEASGGYSHAEGLYTNTDIQQDGTERVTLLVTQVYDKTIYFSNDSGYSDTTAYLKFKIWSASEGDYDQYIVGTLNNDQFVSSDQDLEGLKGGLSPHSTYIDFNSDNTISDSAFQVSFGASHAEGIGCTATGDGSHAEGADTKAKHKAAHSEGSTTIALGYSSHAEGVQTTAEGGCSHAEGSGTTARGYGSHAEGDYTGAVGEYSHSEGSWGDAIGWASHSEGFGAFAYGNLSHAEGHNTCANGECSHTEGSDTIASGDYQHVEGKWNIEDTEIDMYGMGKYLHIAGNGTDNDERSNAYTLDWDGNGWYAGGLTVEGDLTVNGNVDGVAPAYTYGTTDLVAGSSELETGKLYFVYE